MYLSAGNQLVGLPSWLVWMAIGAGIILLVQLIKSGKWRNWFGF